MKQHGKQPKGRSSKPVSVSRSTKEASAANLAKDKVMDIRKFTRAGVRSGGVLPVSDE